MKQTTTLFRLLIVVGIGIAILGAGIDFFVPGIVPTVLANAYESFTAAEEPAMPWVLALGICGLLILIGGIAATIGLLLFKHWSRRLALWVSLLSVLIYPALGPVVYSGWAFMLIETSSMLWGAALAMAYFSELNARFEHDRQSGAPAGVGSHSGSSENSIR